MAPKAAELANISCIFADEVAWAPMERLWLGLRRRFRRGPDDRLKDAFLNRTGTLKTVAGRYGVPLVSLQSALSVGLLSELGVQQDAITELHSWLSPRSHTGWRHGRAAHG